MSYRYRWAGDYAVVVADHTTPEGSGVLAEPGREFETTTPFEHPFALPVTQQTTTTESATEAAATAPAAITEETP